MQIEILKFIQLSSNSVFDILSQIFTIFGEEYIIVALAAIVFLSIDKDKGYKLIFVVASSTCFNSFIKNIFKVQRPIGLDEIVSKRLHTATSYSFPSGHTQAATAFWTATSKIFDKKQVYIVGTVIVILVALSRLYLGVHWPTDVIFGILFGFFWSNIALKVFDYIHKNKNYILLITISLFFVICTILFGDEDFFKSSGLLLGLSVGYIIETKYINFSINMSILKKFILYIIFLGGLLIVKSCVKIMFPIDGIFFIIAYFCVGFWALGIAPIIGKLIGNEKNKKYKD